MGLLALFLLAVGVSMDACAVSISTGLGLKRLRVRDTLIVGLYFGFFQAVMPLIGYFIGSLFADFITGYDHWVAFVLLGIIGGKMIKDSFGHDDGAPCGDIRLTPKKMLPLALATSIDALAIGVSFASLQVDLLPAVGFIGLVTLVLSAIGVKIGNLFGLRYRTKAELIGGIILVVIGLKILLEHLNVISF